jgi:hypothetical protein
MNNRVTEYCSDYGVYTGTSFYVRDLLGFKEF